VQFAFEPPEKYDEKKLLCLHSLARAGTAAHDNAKAVADPTAVFAFMTALPCVEFELSHPIADRPN
jgi:hypothetical protein